MKWTSITNEMPAEMQEVIFHDELMGVFIGYYHGATDSYICSVDGTKLKATSHWMPLPPLPTTEKLTAPLLSSFNLF